MKVSIAITLLILCSCLNKSTEHREIVSFETENTHERLSESIKRLVVQPVDGYVLTTRSALEYSSAEKARQDTSPPHSIAKFDTEKVHLHLPLSVKNDQLYNWGSPLICRKVIADLGDVVEVNTLDDEEPEKLGHGGLGADYMFNLKTFVRKVDLVPVLAFPFKVEFEDMTYIEFDPGVAVGIPWNSDETKRAVSVQQMHFEFSIPDSHLALSYNPVLHNLKNIEGQLMLDEQANLFLGEKEFCPVSEIRKTRLRTPMTTTEKGDKKFVEIIANGIKLRVQTDRELVKAYTPNIDLPTLTPKYDTPPRWYFRIQEGTPVYWDDGRFAGKVRQYFGSYSEMAPGDSTWCELKSELFSNEILCFKLDDIQVIDNQENR